MTIKDNTQQMPFFTLSRITYYPILY